MKSDKWTNLFIPCINTRAGFKKNTIKKFFQKLLIYQQNVWEGLYRIKKNALFPCANAILDAYCEIYGFKA
jgi:hypothetical protein